MRLSELVKKKIEHHAQEISRKIASRLKNVWNIDNVKIVIPQVKLSKAISVDVLLEDKYIGEISIFSRGSGLQREFIIELLKVYYDLKISKGFLFIIEEPENFLHASAQKRFVSILKKLSQEGQVIITTHSTIFINESDLNHTYLLKKQDGETKLSLTKDIQTRLNEIIKELGVTPSDILISNGIILVEGPSDAKVLEIFARNLIKDWNEYNIAILVTGGSNIHYYRDNPILLSKINHNIAIILDSDIEKPGQPLPEEKEKFKNRMEKQGIKVYFWKKNGKLVRELENLFDHESINKALHQVYPKLTKNCDKNIIKKEELKPHEKVVDLVIDKLKKCNPQMKEEDLRKTISKTNIDPAIARIMAENNRIPNDVKEILEQIIKHFSKNPNSEKLHNNIIMNI